MRQKWFDREFPFDLPLERFPLIVERLRGTPARLQDRLMSLPTDQLRRSDDGWSIQENAGHLVDLEPLWAGRLDDLLSGAKELRAADLSNAATHNGNHNASSIHKILQRFKTLRLDLVSRLDPLTEEQIEATAQHPRLKQPMRTIDLAYFVAEHDDHHLARITELIRELV